MAKLETEHIFSGTVTECFQGIKQYGKYPDYMPGITSANILPPRLDGSSCQARYEINIIKSFYYVLDLFETEPNKIWWQLADSNIMKSNEGSWLLQEAGKNKVRAVYTLEVKFKGLVPSAITDKVAQANLPLMLSGFQRLIDQCKAKT